MQWLCLPPCAHTRALSCRRPCPWLGVFFECRAECFSRERRSDCAWAATATTTIQKFHSLGSVHPQASQTNTISMQEGGGRGTMHALIRLGSISSPEHCWVA